MYSSFMAPNRLAHVQMQATEYGQIPILNHKTCTLVTSFLAGSELHCTHTDHYPHGVQHLRSCNVQQCRENKKCDRATYRLCRGFPGHSLLSCQTLCVQSCCKTTLAFKIDLPFFLRHFFLTGHCVKFRVYSGKNK